MDIILVPGFWLDASSWDEVTPPLVAAGHRVHPLTLPGLESRDANRSGIGLRDHVNAVVRAIDEVDGPVVLVGHSGGGAVIYGAIDERPDRVARAIYVDSLPLGEGNSVNDGLPVVGDEIPMPDWDVFDDESLVGLTDKLRAAFRARAIPTPRGASYDAQHLHDERRLDVPATVISSEMSVAQLRELMLQPHPYVAELARIHDLELVDLPTGHWPQFSKPAELAAAILAAVDRP